MPIDGFLSALENAGCEPKQRGDRWECRCPAHDDRVASLSVAEGEKGVVLTCHAGCSPESVVASVGWKMADLFREQRKPRAQQTRAPDREWPVKGIDGNVVAVHVRRDLGGGKKKFLWRRGDVWDLGDLGADDMPLYGCERLASTPGAVFVTEGEKAADALVARELLAVATVTGASGCPSETVLAMLAGRDVLLWPDNDAPGARHMNVVGVGLRGVAKSVSVVVWADAPPKGDAFDFRGDKAAVLALPARPFEKAPAEPVERELRTELGNARRIVRMHGDRLRHTGAVGWLAWDGRRWRPDDTAEAMRYAKKAVVSMLDEAKALGASEEAESLAKWAIKSQKQSVIAASLSLAQSEPSVAVRRSDFDRDPWLLNAENGTVDLRTKALRAHEMADLLTKCCGAPYDATAHSPLWDQFLEKFLPDADVRGFFKRYMGSCLSGDASDQALVILFGPGGNGKSTAIETVTRVMGDYFAGTPFSTLTMSRDRGQATNDLAALAGARFVVASEPPEGASLNTSTVKTLTGGDTITARHLYKEFFSFVPQFKLALVTNHKPQISESTHAIWRRVFLVPFSVTVTDDERDENFKARLWGERNGVLRWMVDGSVEHQTVGLSPPATITVATEEYRKEEDSFGAFLDECCILGVFNSQLRSSTLLTAYNDWCKDNGFDKVSVKWLSGKLHEKGLTKRKSGGVMWWQKIALVQQPTQGG